MTEDQKINFEAQGYLILENALSAEELEDLRNAFDTAADGGFLGKIQNHHPQFIQLAEHSTIFPVVHGIIGDVIQLRSILGRRIEPGAYERGWQREMEGMLGVHHPLSTVGVDAVIHLDDTATGASLRVVPGSHRFKSEMPLPELTHINDMPHHVPLDMRAGTVVVHHANVWKAWTTNRSDNAQRLLIYSYNHCWMRQALRPLSEEFQALVTQSHNLSQLFGIGLDVNRAQGYWSREVEGYEPSIGLPERNYSDLKVVGKGVVPNK